MRSELSVMPGTESKVDWKSEAPSVSQVSIAGATRSSQHSTGTLIAGQIARSCAWQIALSALLLTVSLTAALVPAAASGQRDALLPLLVFLALAVAAGLNLFRQISWRRNRYSHPALVWPEIGTPEEVERRVDRELPNGREMPLFGRKFGFTDAFCYCFSPLRTDVIPRMSIVWAYTHVTTHIRNGLPVGRSCKVHVHARNGRKYSIPVWSEAQAHELLTTIGQFAPWATIGYDFATKMAWHSNREAMIREVDARRARTPQTASTTGSSARRLPVGQGLTAQTPVTASQPPSGARHWWTQTDLLPTARPTDRGSDSE